MKTIGILGGLGPEATADYYKEIINGFNKINHNGDLSYPEIVIYSVTMSKFIGLLRERDYSAAANYLTRCLQKMKLAGADFAAISANTPHLLFEEIQSKVDLPLISIVETCAQAAQKAGLTNCALIGTMFTMQNDFYPRVFATYGVNITIPDKVQMELINKRLFEELELGIFKESTKQEILDIINVLKVKENIDSVILGCTEFPLMFRENEYLELPFLNTTKLHVDAIIRECLT